MRKGRGAFRRETKEEWQRLTDILIEVVFCTINVLNEIVYVQTKNAILNQV